MNKFQPSSVPSRGCLIYKASLVKCCVSLFEVGSQEAWIFKLALLLGPPFLCKSLFHLLSISPLFSLVRESCSQGGCRDRHAGRFTLRHLAFRTPTEKANPGTCKFHLAHGSPFECTPCQTSYVAFTQRGKNRESLGPSVDTPDCTHSTQQEAKFMDHRVSIVNMSWDSLCPALNAIWQQKSSLSTQI